MIECEIAPVGFGDFPETQLHCAAPFHFRYATTVQPSDRSAQVMYVHRSVSRCDGEIIAVYRGTGSMKNDMASQIYGTTMTQRDTTADLTWLRKNTNSAAVKKKTDI